MLTCRAEANSIIIMKKIKITGIVILVLAAVFLAGPRETAPELNLKLTDSLPSELRLLSDYIDTRESNIKNMKADNHAKIIWAEPDSFQQTEYAFVYLHGFSASREEANGIYPELAERYGANIFLARLQAHGTQSENNLLDFDIQKYWQSAQEALLIGKKLGKKVVLAGTSTGGTLALMLAAQYEDVHGLMLYSPNIDLYDKSSFALKLPWGLQIARLAMGGKHRAFDATDEQKKYWQHRYRIEALIRLKVMLSAFMKEETFEKVKQPCYLAYYYKDEEKQDKVVSVEAMLEMFRQLGTAENLKRKHAFPNAEGHVLTWKQTAKSLEEVKKSSFAFLEEVLKMPPVKNSFD